ncbi:MAG: hypothetical protein IIT60_08300, partial [Muribaculaceae bacterium]|nr:hypothetical protein [Muribaculaceae bacterium]
ERSIEFFYDSTRFHPLEGEVVWKHSRWSPDSWFVKRLSSRFVQWRETIFAEHDEPIATSR